jgi:Rad3-related DNA helicase
VLVSPAITQGFDFAGEASEYQILPKMPFPDGSNLLTRARTAADINRPKTEEERERKQVGTDYLDYTVAQALIQACGRSMRSAQDRCMSFILDDNWKWWRWRAEKGGCFPWWFRRLLKTSLRVPRPLPGILPILPGIKTATPPRAIEVAIEVIGVGGEVGEEVGEEVGDGMEERSTR